jgi:hypothetical protein
LIRVLIEREFGVLYNRCYVCELMRNLGDSFQKARFVSDHLDEAKRLAWKTEEWPRILKAARKRKARILFGDEASFPQWGVAQLYLGQTRAPAAGQDQRQTQRLQGLWLDRVFDRAFLLPSA